MPVLFQLPKKIGSRITRMTIRRKTWLRQKNRRSDPQSIIWLTVVGIELDLIALATSPEMTASSRSR